VSTFLILAGFIVAFAIGYVLGRARGAPPTPAATPAPVASAPDPRDASDFAQERKGLEEELERARTETARYRQLVQDIEDNAPPPLMGPGAPDDLKLIVGVGPVLERMLHQLGVTTFRQVAQWSERDIDEFDAKLHEFPGRIRRDEWVVQARALHQSKYGEALPPRGRG
jgi:predicted flap endonuclease-1-like 5' DNA nuclease